LVSRKTEQKRLLLAIDLDGTLLNDDLQVSEGNLRGLEAAKEAGVTIAIATGRSLESAMYAVDRYDFFNYTLCHNGGLVYDHAEKRRLHVNGIDKDTVRKIVEFCLSEGESLYVRALDLWGLIGQDSTAEKFINLADNPIKQIVSPAELEEQDVISLVVPGDRDKVRRFIEANNLPVTTAISAPQGMDIQGMDVNKGRALQVLAEILGFERPEIIAIGNYFNDIEMLQVANIGIAIANSPTEVRGAADYVTANSNNEDGVLEALQKFVL